MRFELRVFLLFSVVLTLTAMGGRRPAPTEIGNLGSQPISSGLPAQFNCQPTSDFKICMMCNCYHEARGENLQGQVAVARTVYSRVMSSSYPDSACAVVYEPSQFSWTLENSKRSQVLGSGMPGVDANGYHNCLRSVDESLKYRHSWFASHYHTTSISPYWKRTCRGQQRIGSHYFYSGCGGVYPENNKPSGSATGVAVLFSWLNVSYAETAAEDGIVYSEADLDLKVLSILNKNKKIKIKNKFSKEVGDLFTSLKRAPQFTHGDFNGDSKEDTAILFSLGQQDYACVFTAQRPHTLNKKSCLKVSRSPNLYLSQVDHQNVVAPLTGSKKPASYDLLQIENYLGATSAYYLSSDGKLKEFKGTVTQN